MKILEKPLVDINLGALKLPLGTPPSTIEPVSAASLDQRTRHQSILLAVVLVSYLMGVLDVAIVITALPKMMREFNASPSGISWVHSVYALTYGGLLLLGARAGDLVGRKRMYLIGLSIFTVASVAIGFSQSLSVLLIARALQGAGAAILGPTTLALLTTTFPEGPARARAVSYYGAVAGVGASIGLVLGGFFADALSWRMGFFINLPIGIALYLAARHHVQESEAKPGQFDLAGAITSTLGMTALVFGIVNGSEHGWSLTAIGSLVFAASFLIVFVLNEWRVPQPIMPLRLFAHKERVGAYAARMLFLGGMMGFWVFMTQYFQTVRHESAIGAALAFLPMTLISFFTALAVPSLGKIVGSKNLIAIGILLTTAGLFWVSNLSSTTHYFVGLGLPMMIIGIGQGLTLGPLTGSGIAQVEPEVAGAAAGLVNVSQQVGGSVGLAVLVAVFTGAGLAQATANDSFTHRVAMVVTGSSIMHAVALVLVIVLILRPSFRRTTVSS